VAFPTTPLDITVEAALGADLTDVPAAWVWTDITAWVLSRYRITIERGGADESPNSSFRPSRVTFTLDNRDGRFTPTNPTGAWYGTWGLDTPIRVTVNASGSDVTRITAFVSALQHSWPAVKEAYAETTVTASGVLRRLSQGRPLRSALYRILNPSRSTSPYRPVEYWPMEGGRDTQLVTSALKGGPSFGINGSVAFGSSTSIPGSAPLPVLDPGAFFTAPVRPYTSPSPNAWAVRWAMWLPSTPSTACTLFQVNSSGTVVRWRLTLTPGTPDTLTMTGLNSAGTEVLGATPSSFIDLAGNEAYAEPLWFEVNAVQNGANIDWDYTVWTHGGGYGFGSSVAGATLGNVTGVQYGPGGVLEDPVLGHIGIGTSPSFYAFAASAAANGNAGDLAWARWTSLIQTRPDVFQDLSTPEPATVLGVEQTADLVTALRQVAETELGLAFETVDSKLKLVGREAQYNAAVALTLDYDSHQLAVPWSPTDDDQQARNDWTVSRFAGGDGRYVAPQVDPDSASYDPTKAVYDDQATVNVYQDADLSFHAGWRVHLGQLGTQRYPQVGLNLARATSLIPAWLACDIGSRIQVTNPPSQLAPDTIDLMLVGYTETVSQYEWRVDLNCVRWPFDVWELEDSVLGFLDTAGSTLASGVNSSATSLSVATPSGPLWTTGAQSTPIEVAGEKMTVTNVSGSSSPQTFTVTRHVNGVTKSQSSGAVVEIWRGGVLAL
jgi:hypothetical protein